MAADHLVVVGASLAGLRSVEAARRSGHRGRVTLVGAESHPPYDRPPLSKDFLNPADPPDVPWHRDDAVLAELEVDLRLGTRATALDPAARRIEVGGEWVGYDALVIATGAAPRSLPGADDLAGVHTLRTLDDARAIRAALDRGARTVVVGAGFIGSEVAAAARLRGLPVTIVEALPVPMARAIGAEMGAAISRLHEVNGTEVRCGVAVTGLAGDGRVERVLLSDGEELRADLVVVGIGTVPETDWLRSSGLDVRDGIACDATLCAGPPGVYAAGDVARWYSARFGRGLRIEHWTNASEQGALAARNALDPAAARPYDGVPYFWSDCYDSKIQFAGIPDAEEIEVVGDPDALRFTALYRGGDRLVGALSVNQPGRNAKCQVLIARGAGWREALERIGSRAPTP